MQGTQDSPSEALSASGTEWLFLPIGEPFCGCPCDIRIIRTPLLRVLGPLMFGNSQMILKNVCRSRNKGYPSRIAINPYVESRGGHCIGTMDPWCHALCCSRVWCIAPTVWFVWSFRICRVFPGAPTAAL